MFEIIKLVCMVMMSLAISVCLIVATIALYMEVRKK